mmetsp:Transcript_129240/g.258064  ORF Transcript_129240/g.258064 Transcript_129240/m.258064 type:complete len:199 (-) Transcript_129240:1322-1918(-)
MHALQSLDQYKVNCMNIPCPHVSGASNREAAQPILDEGPRLPVWLRGAGGRWPRADDGDADAGRGLAAAAATVAAASGGISALDLNDEALDLSEPGGGFDLAVGRADLVDPRGVTVTDEATEAGMGAGGTSGRSRSRPTSSRSSSSHCAANHLTMKSLGSSGLSAISLFISCVSSLSMPLASTYRMETMLLWMHLSDG